VGYKAGYSNTTTTGITAIGTESLYSNTTGYNTAVGYRALYTNTTGSDNVAIGGSGTVAAALRFNDTGSYNTAVGTGSLQANTTASNNTAVGYQAGYSAVQDSNSTYLGYQAGYSANFGTASSQTNTFVGYRSGYSMTTGYYNTILGSFSGNQGGLDIRTATNHIVLSDGQGNPRGYHNGSGWINSGSTITTAYFWSQGVGTAGGLYLGSAGSANGLISQGSGGTGTTTTYIGNAAITTVSDIRLKENIVNTQRNALNILDQLRVVDHTWNDPSDQCENNRNSRGTWMGLIAQEAQPVIPWLVNKPTADVDENGDSQYWHMDYGYAVPLLVKAIQELKAEVDSLKAQINGASA